MKFDYDKMYATQEKEHFDWVKKTGEWKANKLCELIEDEGTYSILEIGTGRGDVLNKCYSFTTHIGADTSTKALEQQRFEYGTKNLVKIDAEATLPFREKKIDFVLLCDILEHVNNPVGLLREAARIGKYVLLKIPVEKALLVLIMHKLRGVKYGKTHPSGHLHCWKLNDILSLIDNAGLIIIREKFIRTSIKLTQKKIFIKTIVFYFSAVADFFTARQFVTRCLIGGSYFAIVRKKH